MSIIIDSNTLSAVFDKTCEEHKNFKLVKVWVESGPGSVVYGGSKFLEELKAAFSYLKLFGELKKKNKAHEIDQSMVDDEWDRVKVRKSENKIGKKFNDEHVVALLVVSGCVLICTKDKKSHPFLLNKALYPKKHELPSIYSGHKNCTQLLCRENLVRPRNCV